MNTISTMGRATQGVRVMNLDEGELIVSVERVADAGDPEVETAIDTSDAVDAVVIDEAEADADAGAETDIGTDEDGDDGENA